MKEYNLKHMCNVEMKQAPNTTYNTLRVAIYVTEVIVLQRKCTIKTKFSFIPRTINLKFNFTAHNSCTYCMKRNFSP